MNLALNQARKNLGNTKENPSVGCVIVKNNNMISAGCTSLGGRPHAEYNAIKSSKYKINQSDLYVTLEPCSHYGKTPPCVKLIIKNRIKKVFFSVKDPDLRSYNRSIKSFKINGVKVKNGVLKNKVNNFYKSYFKYKKYNLPFVTSKLAVSKDLYTINNKKRWITNEFSRARVHLMRSYHDCIITSSATVNADNPRLTCRINGLLKRSPSRIILDNKLKINVNSLLIKYSKRPRTIIFYNKNNIKKINILKKLNIKTYYIPLDNNGNLNLNKVLLKAKKLGYSRIFVEAGKKLTSGFLNNNLVDKFVLYVSNYKLAKYGKANIKDYLKKYLRNKKAHLAKVNLFGEKLLSYKIK